MALARTLLEHMTQGGLLHVRAQADRLLGVLMARAPGLAFEPRMLAALLEALAAEDRLHTAALTPDAQSVVLPRLRQVLQPLCMDPCLRPMQRACCWGGLGCRIQSEP